MFMRACNHLKVYTPSLTIVGEKRNGGTMNRSWGSSLVYSELNKLSYAAFMAGGLIVMTDSGSNAYTSSFHPAHGSSSIASPGKA